MAYTETGSISVRLRPKLLDFDDGHRWELPQKIIDSIGNDSAIYLYNLHWQQSLTFGPQVYMCGQSSNFDRRSARAKRSIDLRPSLCK